MLFEPENKMVVMPTELSQANDFVKKNHTHAGAEVGHLFSLALWLNRKLIGVCIVGRPKSRHLDDGLTVDISRNCVLRGYPNACSKLYGAAIRMAKKRGFKKAITYTLMSEHGSSVKAANFLLEAENCGGKEWTGNRKFKCKSGELKRRWGYEF
jgi:hypothetical protein